MQLLEINEVLERSHQYLSIDNLFASQFNLNQKNSNLKFDCSWLKTYFERLPSKYNNSTDLLEVHNEFFKLSYNDDFFVTYEIYYSFLCFQSDKSFQGEWIFYLK